MDISKIDTIFVELITLFDDVTLSRFLLVNKKLSSLVMKHFTKKLNDRYQECLIMGELPNLETLCYHYMRMLVYYALRNYGAIYILNYNDKIKKLEYNHCRCCKKFSRVNEKQKLCKKFCIIDCCDKKNALFRTSHSTHPRAGGPITLDCGCLVSSQIDIYFNNFPTKACICEEPINPQNKKCKNCGCMPLDLIGV
jgi:hypothetical protein